jgi:mannan endo-1,4-beta-mannosidase
MQTPIRHTLNKVIKNSRFIISGCLLLTSLAGAYAQEETLITTIEAELGTRAGGVTVGTSHVGYQGTGYVTNFKNSTDKITVTANVPTKAYYRIKIRYSTATYGQKNQSVYVNNNVGTTSVVFPISTGFSLVDAGKYLMEAGNNTITLQSEWGWIEIDNFSVYAIAAPVPVFNIDPNPVNTSANSETKALYNFLTAHFGKNIISGQTNDWYDKIKPITGKSPMLRAFDFQHYTQGYPYKWSSAANGWVFGAEDDGQVQQAIDWHQQTGGKGIVSYQWHWHSPTGGSIGTNTFYTSQTSFDVTRAIQNGTTENILILQDIDAVAEQLKRLQSANVPVLWRPLHEAGGQWFWWGAKGSAPCKELYAILYNRLTNHHGLNNLIWVWSSPEADWYPGNSTVDMVGYDSYPGAYNYDAQKNFFDQLYTITNGKKLVAMTENGPVPNPDDCFELHAPWSLFMSWSDLVTAQNTNQHLIDVYNHPNVLTLETATSVPSMGDSKSILTIYPTPSTNVIHLKAEGMTSIEITDLNGRTMFSSATAMNTINTESFPCGIYVVRVSTPHAWLQSKMVVKR